MLTVGLKVAFWQEAALQAFCDGLALAERLGRWPADLRRHPVALLPKRGSRQPGDRRHIFLFSPHYRAWVSIRAGEMRRPRGRRAPGCRSRARFGPR